MVLCIQYSVLHTSDINSTRVLHACSKYTRVAWRSATPSTQAGARIAHPMHPRLTGTIWYLESSFNQEVDPTPCYQLSEAHSTQGGPR